MELEQKIIINIFDDTCQHHVKKDGYFTSTEGRKPLLADFVHKKFEFDGITIFTDNYIMNPIVDKVKSNLKIAWCLESPAVQQYVNNNIQLVEEKFDYIFTYREDLIQKNSKKYKPNTPGGSFIKDEDIDLYFFDKIKNCSIILSGKQDLEGHKLRHLIANNCEGIDLFGWGTSNGYIDNKLVALKNYKFNIVIENTRTYHYFTEKLIDCLLTGCIPIYWGAINIEKYFDINGFILFDSIESLRKIKINDKVFFEKKDSIKNNFELAKKYISSDDLLIKKIKKLTSNE